MKHEPAKTIIDRLGGISSIARRIGKPPVTVWRWSASKDVGGCGGLIPARYMGDLIRIASEDGIPLDGNDFVPKAAQVETADLSGN